MDYTDSNSGAAMKQVSCARKNWNRCELFTCFTYCCCGNSGFKWSILLLSVAKCSSSVHVLFTPTHSIRSPCFIDTDILWFVMCKDIHVIVPSCSRMASSFCRFRREIVVVHVGLNFIIFFQPCPWTIWPYPVPAIYAVWNVAQCQPKPAFSYSNPH